MTRKMNTGAREILETLEYEIRRLSDGAEEQAELPSITEKQLSTFIQKNPSAILSTEDLRKMFEYSSILLEYGSYEICIKLCEWIISLPSTFCILPEQRLKIVFLQAKAYRNSGQYSLALKTLHSALDYTEEEKCSYMKGAALLRIGKVYSEYLMMTNVSIHFLEEAESELIKWRDHPDESIRLSVKNDYAICLDSIGQYWRNQNQYEKALEYFSQAEKINRNLERNAGILRNQAHAIVTEMKQIAQIDSSCVEKQQTLISKMQSIVRALLNDSKNEKGAGVRYAQLAEMYLAAGRESDARFALRESRQIAHKHGDVKTLARAATIELQYFPDNELGENLREVSTLVKKLNYYHWQTDINDLAISAIKEDKLPGFDVIAFLQENRAVYSKLSEIAKNTIITISDHSIQSEFSHLSTEARFSLLSEIVESFDWFTEKMNRIIDELIKISKERSDSLNAAAISEAKASLASSVLHDFKHIIETPNSGEKAKTILDPVLDGLQSETEITPTTREDLANKVSVANERLKKILSQINEATRVPRDFHERINVRDVFLIISDQKPEEYMSISEEIRVDCDKAIQIEYNTGLFTILFKELLRNAIDYQCRNSLKIDSFVLKGERSETGFISLSVLTSFQELRDADKAFESISEQLSGNSREYGYGLKLLYNFILCKTGSTSFIVPVKDKDTYQAGLSFKIPVSEYHNTERKE